MVGTVCFPIDTVKRRLMVQRKLPTAAPAAVSTGLTPSAGLGGSVVHAAAHSGSSAGGLRPSAVVAEAGGGAPATRSPHVPYRSGWDCLRRILAEEGVRGLFAGLSVNLVRGVTGAILLVAYDDFKKLM